MKNNYTDAMSNLRLNDDFDDKTIQWLIDKTEKKSSKWVNKQSLAIATIAIMVFGVFILQYVRFGREDFLEQQIALEKTNENIRVYYTEEFTDKQVMVNYDLAMLTEEEIFNGYETSIFLGEVLSIENITVEFPDENNYWSLVTIKVEESYRGVEEVGEQVIVRFPFPFSEEYWVEDTDTLSNVVIGSRGIFMPIKYDELNEIYRENGVTLYLSDLADYGFLDGERFAFIESDDGVIFAQWAYENIDPDSNLEEIKEYILEIVK